MCDKVRLVRWIQLTQRKLAIGPTAGYESERPCFRRLTIPPEITWTLAQPARVNHNRQETEPVLACSGPDSDSVIGFGSRSRTAGRHPRVRVYGEPRLPALCLCSRCGQGFQPKCRVPLCLLCAGTQALRKDLLYRVPPRRHMAKYKHTTNVVFAECLEVCLPGRCSVFYVAC